MRSSYLFILIMVIAAAFVWADYVYFGGLLVELMNSYLVLILFIGLILSVFFGRRGPTS